MIASVFASIRPQPQGATGFSVDVFLRDRIDPALAARPGSPRDADLRLWGSASWNELVSLSAERDPETLCESLLNLGARLELEGRTEAAQRLYTAALDIDLPSGATARRRLEDLRRRGSSLHHAESLLRGLAQEACNPAALLAMAAGGAAFRMTRVALLSRWSASGNALARGWGGRLLASAGALAVEVPVFTGVGRMGHRALGRGGARAEIPLGTELASNFLMLGALKGAAGLARPIAGSLSSGATKALFQQTATLAGILAGHRLEEWAGLRRPVTGAAALFESLATLIQFHAAGRLTQTAFGPGFAAWERALELRGRLLELPRAEFRGPGPDAMLVAASTGALRAPSSPGEAIAPRPLFMMGGDDPSPFAPRLQLRLSSGEMHPFEELSLRYQGAEKRRYTAHGLDFEYALLRARDCPYLVKIGSMGLSLGDRRFVVEDFFPETSLDPETRRRLVELVAVHEYGESLFNDHHQASLLEFAVAEREGFLPRYLEILEAHYAPKFRDVALNRMGDDLLLKLEARGVAASDSFELENLGRVDPESVSARRAAELRDSFRWPEELRRRHARAVGEDPAAVDAALEAWAEARALELRLDEAWEPAVETALEEPPLSSDTPREYLRRIEKQFYDRLSEPDLLDDESIPAERLPAVGSARAEGLRQRVSQNLRSRFSLPPHDSGVDPLLSENAFLRRDLAEHLRVAHAFHEANRQKNWVRFKNDPNFYASLWHDAEARITEGRSARFSDALAEKLLLHRIESVLDGFLNVRMGGITAWMRSHPGMGPAEVYADVLSELRSMALDRRDDFSRLEDAELQELVDAKLTEFWRQRFASIPSRRPPPFPVAELRSRFGRAFESFPPNNRN